MATRPTYTERTYMDIVKLLDELADLQDESELARLDYEAKRSGIMKAIQSELEALDAEYKPKITLAQERIDAMTTLVKGEVLDKGASVKGSRLHAVYASGRVTWDTKKLDGLAMAFPPLAEARKVGNPSVSIRALK